MTARAFLISTPPIRPDVEKRQPPKHIPVDSIVLIQADTKYVDVYDADGTSYILDSEKENTIKALALEFSDVFVEVCRGCLVRRSEIRAVTAGDRSATEVVLKCGMRVPISRRNKAAIRRLVADFRDTLPKPRCEIVEDNTDFENNVLDVTFEIRHA